MTTRVQEASSLLHLLPHNLKRTIIHYLLTDTKTYQSAPLFPHELQDWDDIVLENTWHRQYIYPSLGMGKSCPHKTYKHYTRELVIMAPMWPRTTVNPHEIHLDTVACLKNDWSEIRYLEMMYERFIHPQVFTECLELHFPQLQSIKLKMTATQAIDVFEALSQTKLRSLNSLALYFRNRPGVHCTGVVMIGEDEQRWRQCIERMQDRLVSLEIIHAIIPPSVLKTIQMYQKRLSYLRVSIDTQTFSLVRKKRLVMNISHLHISNLVVDPENTEDYIKSAGADILPYLNELTVDQVICSVNQEQIVAPNVLGHLFSAKWSSLRRLKIPFIHDKLAQDISKNLPNLMQLKVKSNSVKGIGHRRWLTSLNGPNDNNNNDNSGSSSINRHYNRTNTEMNGLISTTALDPDFAYTQKQSSKPWVFTNTGLLSIVQNLKHLRVMIIIPPSDTKKLAYILTSQAIFKQTHSNSTKGGQNIQAKITEKPIQWSCHDLYELEIINWGGISIDTMGHLLHQLPGLMKLNIQISRTDEPMHLNKTWPSQCRAVKTINLTIIDNWSEMSSKSQQRKLGIIDELLLRCPNAKDIFIHSRSNSSNTDASNNNVNNNSCSNNSRYLIDLLAKKSPHIKFINLSN